MALGFTSVNGSAKKSGATYMKLADGNNTFRILPNSILPMYTYWVKSPATGKDVPFEALQFDRATEKFDNSLPCPVNELRLTNAKGEPLRCQWSYKCLVINRATGLVEVLQLKKGMLTDIISIAKQMGADPTDLDTGFDITVERKKTGPLPFNVEYIVNQFKIMTDVQKGNVGAGEADRVLIAEAKNIEEMFERELVGKMRERLAKVLSGETGGDEDDEGDKADQSAAAREAIKDLA